MKQVIGVPGGKKKERIMKVLFEMGVDENFQNLNKDTKSQIQGAP